MASQFTRILLAMLVGFALSGITACDQPGPTEEAEVDVEETIEEATEPAAVAAPPSEAVVEVDEVVEVDAAGEVEVVEEETIMVETAEPEEEQPE